MSNNSTVSGVAMLSAGIFAREHGQRFLQILVSLGDRGFEGLYRKCQGNTEGSYYQSGLKRVHAWSDDVLMEDIDFVKSVFPDIYDTFENCFFAYVEDRYRGRRKTSIRTPGLLSFVRLFLECLGTQDALVTADYFARRDPVLKRITCMDAARTALFALANTEDVQVELLSEAASSVRPLAQTTARELRTYASSEVTPNDSISQVDVPGMYRRAPASPPRSTVSQRVDPPPVPPPHLPDSRPTPSEVRSSASRAPREEDDASPPPSQLPPELPPELPPQPPPPRHEAQHPSPPPSSQPSHEALPTSTSPQPSHGPSQPYDSTPRSSSLSEVNENPPPPPPHSERHPERPRQDMQEERRNEYSLPSHAQPEPYYSQRVPLPERAPSEISYHGPSSVVGRPHSDVFRSPRSTAPSDVFRAPDTHSVVSRHEFEDHESPVVVERPPPVVGEDDAPPRRVRSNVDIGLKKMVHSPK